MSWRVALVVSLGICLLGSIDAGAGPARCHQVRPGDTLAAIAPRYRTSVEELLRLNRTGRKAIIRVGSVLMLPPTLTHRPLFATPGRLGRESAGAQGDGLSRMRNDRMTSRFRRSGLLVAIPAVTRTYYVGGQKALGPDNNVMVGLSLPLDLNRRKEGRVGVAGREMEMKQAQVTDRERRLQRMCA